MEKVISILKFYLGCEKMKRIITVMVGVLLSFVLFSSQVLAITDTQYIDYLKEKGFAQEYITYAQNHFKSYKYTGAQIDTLKFYSDKVLEIAMAKNPEVITLGSTKFDKSKFTNAEEDQILEYVTKGAEALGLTAVITRGADSIRYIEFYNKAGKKIGSVQPKYNVLKYTDGTLAPINNYIYFSLALIALLALVTAVVKKIFAKKEVAI